MKKLTVLALLAAVMIVTPAFAVQRTAPVPTFVFTGASAAPVGTGPATTNNNDSCDIGVTPAATLLLPYFEVETSGAAGTGPTTLFTITNTSRFAQIAHVTLWTDWSIPVLDFNVFLTGYDVQSINLFDVIVRGYVAQNAVSGTSSIPSTTVSPIGSPSLITPSTIATPATTTNPATGSGTVAFNPYIAAAAYASASTTGSCNGLPGTLPPFNVTYALTALTTGVASGSAGTGVCTSGSIGSNHGTRAVGYATIDLVDRCTQALPTAVEFYNDLLYDNVLIGDYQQIGPSPSGTATGSGFDAAGNPLVHIRAVPEGGASTAGGGLVVPTNLPFTFYNRYEQQTGLVINQDRRQPLPSQWAARWIGGTQTNSGTTVTFNSDYKIWREGVTGGGATACATSVTGVAATNSAMPVTAIRFDENENAFGTTSTTCPVSPCPPGPSPVSLPETSRVAVGTTNGTATAGTAPVASGVFPPLVSSSTQVGGWVYMNLANGGSPNLTASRAGFNTVATTTFTAPVGTTPAVYAVTPTTVTLAAGSNAAGTAATFARTTSQNWVIVSLFGNLGTQRLAVDFDAAWLGNGCTPAPPATAVVGPLPYNEPTGALVCNPLASATGTCPTGTAVPVPNP